MRRLPPALLLLSGLVPAAARADEAKAVRLEYEASSECPDRAVFVEQVLRRSPGVRLADEGEVAPEFRVVVVRGDGGSSARLTVRDGAAAPVERELAAPDCAELVASMAVVIALAIDARASIGATDEPPAAASAPPSQGARRDTGASGPVAAPAAVVETAANRPAPATNDEAAAAEEPAATLPVRGHPWVIGAAAAVVSDIAPQWSPGVQMFSDFGLSGDVRGRLSLGYATSGERSLDGAVARFSLLAGRAELCPAVLQPTRSLSLRPCGAFEVGLHRAEGEVSERIEAPKSSSALWLAAVLGLRAELQMTRLVAFELEAQARVPFLHQTFVLERPDQVVFETPNLGAGVQLGVSVPLIW